MAAAWMGAELERAKINAQEQEEGKQRPERMKEKQVEQRRTQTRAVRQRAIQRRRTGMLAAMMAMAWTSAERAGAEREQQQQTAAREQGDEQWAKAGLRGVRVGEAALPGPPKKRRRQSKGGNKGEDAKAAAIRARRLAEAAAARELMQRAVRQPGEDVQGYVFINLNEKALREAIQPPRGAVKGGQLRRDHTEQLELDSQVLRELTEGYHDKLRKCELLLGQRKDTGALNPCKGWPEGREIVLQFRGISAARAGAALRLGALKAKGRIAVRCSMQRQVQFSAARNPRICQADGRTTAEAMRQLKEGHGDWEGLDNLTERDAGVRDRGVVRTGARLVIEEHEEQARARRLENQRCAEEAGVADNRVERHRYLRKERARRQQERKGGDEEEYRTYGAPPKEEGTLRIIQWNINGIHRKRVQLLRLLEEVDADVATVQETHIKPGGKMPPTLIKEQTHLTGQEEKRKMTASADFRTQAHHVKIHVLGQEVKPVSIVNAYAPPGSGVTNLWRPDRLQSGRRTIVCMDLNAYHPKWASVEDARNKEAPQEAGDAFNRGRKGKDRKRPKPWWTQAIEQLNRKRQELWKRLTRGKAGRMGSRDTGREQEHTAEAKELATELREVEEDMS
eukprot:gene2449-2891_t